MTSSTIHLACPAARSQLATGTAASTRSRPPRRCPTSWSSRRSPLPDQRRRSSRERRETASRRWTPHSRPICSAGCRSCSHRASPNAASSASARVSLRPPAPRGCLLSRSPNRRCRCRRPCCATTPPAPGSQARTPPGHRVGTDGRVLTSNARQRRCSCCSASRHR